MQFQGFPKLFVGLFDRFALVGNINFRADTAVLSRAALEIFPFHDLPARTATSPRPIRP
jgi:hypothetical protein